MHQCCKCGEIQSSNFQDTVFTMFGMQGQMHRLTNSQNTMPLAELCWHRHNNQNAEQHTHTHASCLICPCSTDSKFYLKYFGYHNISYVLSEWFPKIGHLNLALSKCNTTIPIGFKKSLDETST